ncbi:MAG: tetratricopeptide repeat protein [Planctomycetia bacterium]|nr:tetratricopeptide repeat protein [Planctomycetia bacterium]
MTGGPRDDAAGRPSAMKLDFVTLPPFLADRLGLPREKSVPLTPETRRSLAESGPSVEAIVRGCEAYLAVDPDDADYRAFLARYYHHRGAVLANDGRIAEALDLLGKARLLDPANAPAHCDWARASLELEHPEDAIEGWRAAMSAGEKSPELYDGLARAFSMKGDHRSAKTAAEEARKAFPDALLPLHTTATVLYHAGDKAGVEKVLFEALTRAPEDLLTLEKLGVWLRECGRFTEAARVIGKAISLAPAEPRLQYQKGMIEMRGGDPAAAEATFRGLLAARPQDLDARTALAILLSDGSRPAEAEAVLRESLAVDPRDYRAHFHLGRLCCRDAGRIAEGLAHFERMLDLAPRDRHAVHTAYIVASNAGAPGVAAKAARLMREMGEEPGGQEKP